MTPAAFALAKRMFDIKNVGADERKEIRDLLYGAHFFEVTNVMPLVEQFVHQLSEVKDQKLWNFKSDYIFLPAPKTWIEWKLKGGERVAVVLTDQESKTCVWDKDGRRYDDRRIDEYEWIKGGAPKNEIHMLLIMINTPCIVGRRTHHPHRGLERELLNKQKLVGSFPLRAWTEIKLEVTKPPEIDDGRPHEAHLTGQRCLHFCRAHLRVWYRELIFVSSHWRGNGALGIKQSRYLVT